MSKYHQNAKLTPFSGDKTDSYYDYETAKAEKQGRATKRQEKIRHKHDHDDDDNYGYDS